MSWLEIDPLSPQSPFKLLWLFRLSNWEAEIGDVKHAVSHEKMFYDCSKYRYNPLTFHQKFSLGIIIYFFFFNLSSKTVSSFLKLKQNTMKEKMKTFHDSWLFEWVALYSDLDDCIQSPLNILLGYVFYVLCPSLLSNTHHFSFSFLAHPLLLHHALSTTHMSLSFAPITRATAPSPH